MRRGEREITSREEIDEIIRSCKVCRLGLWDGQEPYIVPLCFGYDGKLLYFHGAPEGRKIDILRENPRVCFEFDAVDGILESDEGCRCGVRYKSVIGYGKAVIVDGTFAKRESLRVLMAQYSDKVFSFPDDAIERTCIIRVDIEQLTGKKSW